MLISAMSSVLCLGELGKAAGHCGAVRLLLWLGLHASCFPWCFPWSTRIFGLAPGVPILWHASDWSFR